ncbi:MAG: hypothetical protein H6581_04570 [Bacteroidia bacterium]|nr:hypothetical protein [Bacteroidia bacterium]
MEKSITKKLLFWAALLLGGFSLGQAQCPTDTLYPTDSGQCSAVVNFMVPTPAPYFDTVYFNYTGSPQTWIVPGGLDTVMVVAAGAQGNINGNGVAGGLGGLATGWLPVVPGDTYMVYVGGGAIASTTGGFNGGGNAGTVGCAQAFGGGGGGASDIRTVGGTLGDRVLVAGGGGGAGGDRINGCGRGTGGGGGGGYYGGGGGAAWPYQSVTLPTGGTQSAGGTGGTSSYTSVPNNNGTAGALGTGGTGGDEVTSTQGGSAAGLAGGFGGGTTGGIGAYVSNWTGQSGAGGSGYIGGVINGSMQDGVNPGQGIVVIVYKITPTVTQLSGVAPGDTVAPDSLWQSYEIDYGTYFDTCSFWVVVEDQQAPVAVCASETLNVGATGTAMATSAIDGGSYDNCGLSMLTIWSDTFDCSNAGTTSSAMVYVMDNSGHADSCEATLHIMDLTAPNANCKDLTVTLGTNGTVTINASQIDNGSSDICGSVTTSASPTFFNGQDLGANSVTLTVSDGSGNMSTCTATVTVVDSFLTGIQENGLAGINFSAFPNPSNGNFTVRISCVDCTYEETLELKVVSLHGALIQRRQVELVNGEFNFELNLSDQAAGQYLLSLTGKSGSVFRHLVKM